MCFFNYLKSHLVEILQGRFGWKLEIALSELEKYLDDILDLFYGMMM